MFSAVDVEIVVVAARHLHRNVAVQASADGREEEDGVEQAAKNAEVGEGAEKRVVRCACVDRRAVARSRVERITAVECCGGDARAQLHKQRDGVRGLRVSEVHRRARTNSWPKVRRRKPAPTDLLVRRSMRLSQRSTIARDERMSKPVMRSEMARDHAATSTPCPKGRCARPRATANEIQSPFVFPLPLWLESDSGMRDVESGATKIEMRHIASRAAQYSAKT